MSAGQFTVPSYVLSAMPSSNGFLSVENDMSPQPFSATGLDYGLFEASIIFSTGLPQVVFK